MNVLIAEDNHANQLMITACCTALSVKSTVVGDGAAVVAAIKNASYDLVLMDVHMPVMDGIAATMAIRQSEGAARHALVFGLTGDNSPETRSACLAAGMNEVLPKPLHIPQLSAVLDTVRNALAARAIVSPASSSHAQAPSMEHRLQIIQANGGSASAARLHYLNLANIRERLGPRWEKVADRVAWVTKQVIELHLDRYDFYEEIGLLEFQILFAMLDYDAGELKCASIVRDIPVRLFGEEAGREFEARAEMRDPKTILTRVSARENRPASVSLLAAREVADQDSSSPAPSRWEVPFDLLEGIGIDFGPVLDTQRGKFPIRVARPVFFTTSAIAAKRDAHASKSERENFLERLDLTVQAHFAQSLEGYASLEPPALLALPAHYETLAKPASRLRFAQGLHRIPPEIRARLIVTIEGLPHGLLEMRLGEMQSPLVGLCLNTVAIVDLGYRDFDTLRRNKILIVGSELHPEYRDQKPSELGLPQFSGAAQRVGLSTYLSNIESRVLAEAAHGMFRYVSGPAIAARQKKLENCLPLKRQP